MCCLFRYIPYPVYPVIANSGIYPIRYILQLPIPVHPLFYPIAYMSVCVCYTHTPRFLYIYIMRCPNKQTATRGQPPMSFGEYAITNRQWAIGNRQQVLGTGQWGVGDCHIVYVLVYVTLFAPSSRRARLVNSRMISM